MKYDVVILGGGVSGLMMMNRLRHYHPTMSAIIIDKSTEISDHVFHLHRPIPEIPELCDKEYMKEYKFQSGVWSINGLVNSASIKDINDYSYKCFGKLHVSNAGNSAGFTIIPVTKQKLIKALNVQMATQRILEVISINEDEKYVLAKDAGDGVRFHYNYLISTIPLPSLLKMSGVDHSIKFENFPFWNGVLKLDYHTHMYQQVVNTDPSYGVSRITVFDDEVFVESVNEVLSEKDLGCIRYLLGKSILDPLEGIVMKPVFPGRIGILPQGIRKPLIYWLTSKHNMFCLGRYGAWTYKVANDVWGDAKFICEMIQAKEMGTKYEGDEPWKK